MACVCHIMCWPFSNQRMRSQFTNSWAAFICYLLPTLHWNKWKPVTSYDKRSGHKSPKEKKTRLRIHGNHLLFLHMSSDSQRYKESKYIATLTWTESHISPILLAALQLQQHSKHTHMQKHWQFKTNESTHLYIYTQPSHIMPFQNFRKYWNWFWEETITVKDPTIKKISLHNIIRIKVLSLSSH